MSETEDPREALLAARFLLGDAAFGLDARCVQEVVKVGEPTRVRGASPEVAGIRNLRGRIVTVVDLAAQLGLDPAVPGPESRLLILEDQGELFGLLVDAVQDAVALEKGTVEPPPPSLPEPLRRRLQGVWRGEEGLLTLLDPRLLLEAEDGKGSR